MAEPRTFIGKRIMVYGGIAGGLLSIFALGAAFDLHPPKPVWRGDYDRDRTEMAGSVKSNRELILTLQIDRKLEQIYRQEDRVNDLQARGENARDAKDRLRDLESQLRVLERQLQEAE